MNAHTDQNLFKTTDNHTRAYYFRGRKVRTSKTKDYGFAIVDADHVVSFHARYLLAEKARLNYSDASSLRVVEIIETNDVELIEQLTQSDRMIRKHIKAQDAAIAKLDVPEFLNVSKSIDAYTVYVRSGYRPAGHSANLWDLMGKTEAKATVEAGPAIPVEHMVKVAEMVVASLKKAVDEAISE